MGDWLDGRLAGWETGWMGDWLDGRLAGWETGWMGGWGKLHPAGTTTISPACCVHLSGSHEGSRDLSTLSQSEA